MKKKCVISAFDYYTDTVNTLSTILAEIKINKRYNGHNARGKRLAVIII